MYFEPCIPLPLNAPTTQNSPPDRFRRPTIKYVSGPCGSGKSESAVRNMTESIAERRKRPGLEPNYLYCCPSKDLSREIAARLHTLGVKYEIIDSETDPQSVTKAMLKRLKHCDETGLVLLCTHSGFF